MALQIPDAPNVESTQPVLRQADSINAQFERPNFKIDVSEPVRALKDVGNAYAGFVEQQTEMYMGAACNEFTNQMIKEEMDLKNKYKGIQANDLYAKLEKKAQSLLADITGEPKDDGRVRIANPELQRRFTEWADKQMPAYHARMNAYTASELEQANKIILKNGIENTNAFVMGVSNKLTAGSELKVAKEEYMRAARLSAPGMPEDYQMAEAARLMDEAVYAMMKGRAETNILDALDYFNSVPEIQNALSAKSKAALQATMQKEFKDQAASRSADLAASGAPIIEKNGYLDPNVMKEIFPNATEGQLERMQFEVGKKAEEINAAANEAKANVKTKEYSRLQNYIATVDYTNANDVAEIAANIAVVDKQLADDFTATAQQQLADEAVMREYDTVFDTLDEDVALEDIMTDRENIDVYQAWEKAGLKEAEKEYEEYVKEKQKPSLGTWIHGENHYIDQTKEEFVSKKKEAFIANYYKDMAEGDRLLELANKVQDIKERTTSWIDSPAYHKAFVEAVEGRYHGEYREELKGMPMELRKNLAAIVEYNQRYNEVIAANPKLDEDVKGHVADAKKKSATYMGMLQREVVKEMDRYKSQNGAYPVRDSIEYNSIINEAVRNAESPTKARVERYLSDDSVRKLQGLGYDPYLNPEGAYKKAKELKMLPANVEVLSKVTATSKAEDIADAIIDTASGGKRRKLKLFKESMEKTIEETGNADYWFLFADGIQ